MSSAFTFAPSLLLQSILQYIETADNASAANIPWSYLVLMLVSGAVFAVAEGQTKWLGRKIALRLRAVIIGEIYQQLLRRNATPHSVLSSTSNENSSPQDDSAPGETNDLDAEKSADNEHLVEIYADKGTIINLVVSDATKIADAGANAYEIWAAVPFQVAIALGLLFRILGPSALAGIVMMLLMTPINSVILKHFGKAAAEAMAATDARIQETNQLLRNIRMIKLFVWEDLFQRKVLDKRSAELKAQRARLVWWSIAATIWYTVPFAITFLSFFAYTAIPKKDLTPLTAFTALSLFNLLKAPLDQLIGSLARVQESLLSVSRIEAFLHEAQTGKYTQLGTASKNVRERKTSLLGFEKATLRWSSTRSATTNARARSAFSLTGISATFVEKRLNIIAGATGSGKTSLLMALLREVTLVKGTLSGATGDVAYCAQEAWLLNDTVKNNIVFTSSWDPKRYQEVIDACRLATDLAIMKSGDSTVVGEGGTSLSGGQKQRVALARALYSNSSYVFLDDCLSAVDSHTAE